MRELTEAEIEAVSGGSAFEGPMSSVGGLPYFVLDKKFPVDSASSNSADFSLMDGSGGIRDGHLFFSVQDPKGNYLIFAENLSDHGYSTDEMASAMFWGMAEGAVAGAFAGAAYGAPGGPVASAGAAFSFAFIGAPVGALGGLAKYLAQESFENWIETQ
jgi:hypothetical protein